MLVNVEIADKYQDLFNHLSQEHNLTLTISEMDDIISEAQKVVKKSNRMEPKLQEVSENIYNQLNDTASDSGLGTGAHKWIKDQIRTYVKLIAKRQRDNCANQFVDKNRNYEVMTMGDKGDLCLNAPEPEL